MPRSAAGWILAAVSVRVRPGPSLVAPVVRSTIRSWPTSLSSRAVALVGAAASEKRDPRRPCGKAGPIGATLPRPGVDGVQASARADADEPRWSDAEGDQPLAGGQAARAHRSGQRPLVGDREGGQAPVLEDARETFGSGRGCGHRQRDGGREERESDAVHTTTTGIRPRRHGPSRTTPSCQGPPYLYWLDERSRPRPRHPARRAGYGWSDGLRRGEDPECRQLAEQGSA